MVAGDLQREPVAEALRGCLDGVVGNLVSQDKRILGRGKKTVSRFNKR